MDTANRTNELFLALSAAQGEIENADKNAQNTHFRSSYADLAEVLNTIRPVFSKHGLALIQSTEFNGELVSVCTLIAHKSGGMVSSTASCVPAKTDAQGIGAATTYLRRYGAAAMAGISQEDDDGNTAAHSAPPKRQERPAAPAKINPEQHRLLEARIAELGLDRARVKTWVMNAFQVEHFTDLDSRQLDALLGHMPKWVSAGGGK